MDWRVSDAARQLFWNLHSAARRRIDEVGALVAARRRPLTLVAAGVVVLAASVTIYRGVRGREEAPADEFVGFYCPECRFFFQISHREFEKRWDRGQYGAGADDRTLLFRCNRCGKLTARRANGPPTGT